MSASYLELRSLRCERDQRLLFHGLDCQLELGDLLQVEGPNGSGKTTLLRILSTLSSDFEGEILWQGQPLIDEKVSYLNQMLFIGHHAGVKATLTPRENLAWHCALRGEETGQIEEALASVGLKGYEDNASHTLSAGQQRRVGLARLYLSKATLWILDEPFTAIDLAGVAQLEELLCHHIDHGGAVVMTTHHKMTLSKPYKKLRLGVVEEML